MTTHDQITEATPSPEGVGPATARTEHREEHAASSTVAAEPSTAQTESTVSAGEPSAVATDSVTNQTPPSAAHSEPSTPLSESAIAGTEAPAGMTEATTAQTESPTERSLFADDELAGLRARWDNVQAGSSTIPKSASTKRTAWCRMWSTSSRSASPKRVRGSRNSGLAAKRLPPKTFVSPCGATAISSSGCSRCETGTHVVLDLKDVPVAFRDPGTRHQHRRSPTHTGTYRASLPPDRGGGSRSTL